MAAVFGHMKYWNVSSDMLVEELKKLFNEEYGSPVTIIMSICFLVVSIIAVVGNTLVAAAMWRDPLKTLRNSPTNFILLSLAIADLMVGLILAPCGFLFYVRLAVKEEPWESLWKVLAFSHFFLIVSVGHILLLSIDRYFAIAKPLKYRQVVTKKRASIASSLIWLFCFCYSVLSSLLQQHFFVVWFIFTMIVWCSSESFACLYLITLKKLCKHHKTRITNENSQRNNVLLYEREKKVFIVILSVIIVFYLCILPWLINQFLFFFCQKACHRNNRTWVHFYHVSQVTIFLNSALNPLLYAWRFSKFQATFKYFLIKCCCQELSQRNTTDVTEERQTHDTRL